VSSNTHTDAVTNWLLAAAGAVDNRHRGERGSTRSPSPSRTHTRLRTRLWSLLLAGSVIPGEAQLTKSDVKENSLLFDSIYTWAVPVAWVYSTSLTARMLLEAGHFVPCFTLFIYVQIWKLECGSQNLSVGQQNLQNPDNDSVLFPSCCICIICKFYM